jgi:protein-disulfide isomerase
MRRLMVLSALIAVSGCAGPQTTSAQPSGNGSAVVATIDGTAITEAELRSKAGPELARLESQTYELKRGALDELIAAHLLEAEASRRGVTVKALEADEVTAKVAPVTEAELAAFINTNRQRIRGDADALRPQISEFLTQQKREARRAEFVDALRAAASVSVALEEPAVFRAAIDLDGAPIRGEVDAPVTIVEFSDFHCPFCRSVQPTLSTLLDRYKGKVRLAYKHLPLDALHPNARRVSEASWCAQQQGRFWEFHDVVYAAGGSDASDATLQQFAAQAQLDQDAFTACLAGPEAARAVDADVTEGRALDLNGTPGFYINGRELHGAQPLEAFVRIIDEELTPGR